MSFKITIGKLSAIVSSLHFSLYSFLLGSPLYLHYWTAFVIWGLRLLTKKPNSVKYLKRFTFFFFWDRVLLLLPRMEYNGSILAHRNLLGSSDSPASASLSSWDYRHAPPFPADFVFLVEMGFLHVGQAGLELQTSQVIHPPQPPKVLGLQACATSPSLKRFILSQIWVSLLVI